MEVHQWILYSRKNICLHISIKQIRRISNNFKQPYFNIPVHKTYDKLKHSIAMISLLLSLRMHVLAQLWKMLRNLKLFSVIVLILERKKISGYKNPTHNTHTYDQCSWYIVFNKKYIDSCCIISIALKPSQHLYL